MSEVKSIFGDLQIEEAKDDEDKLVKTLKDFIENLEKLFSWYRKKGAWNSPQSMNKFYRRAEQLVLDVAKGDF